MTINDVISKSNVVSNTEQLVRRRKVYARFAPWLTSSSGIEQWDLMLYPFAVDRPLKYFDPENVTRTLRFLEADGEATLKGLVRFGGELSHAVSHVLQPSASRSMEESPSSSSANTYADVERVWHPEYQRYAEHAYNHLINVLLAVLEGRENKVYCDGALANRVSYLDTKLHMKFLTSGYNQVVRNAISHGHVSFGIASVRYTNRKGGGEVETTDLSVNALLKLFDVLVASCNELLVALILFLLRNWSLVKRDGLENLPVGMLHLALAGAGTHTDLRLVRLIESEALGSRKQLNISCATSVTSRTWQIMTSFRLAALTQDLVGAKYQRFAVSYHCGRTVEASVFLNGERLFNARAHNEGSEVVPEVLETSMLWFDSPRWRLQLTNLWLVYRTLAVETYEKYFEDMTQKGLEFTHRLYEFKSVNFVGAKRGVGVEVKVVLRDGVLPTRQTLKKVAVHAVRRIRLRLYRREKIVGKEGPPQWPSYIRLHVYPRDNVLRRLQGRIRDGAFVEVEWARAAEGPFIYVRAPHEVHHGIRIRYAEGVLRTSEIKTLLDGAASQIAVKLVQHHDELKEQVNTAVAETLAILDGETPPLKRFWLLAEVNRYRRWGEVLEPACDAAISLIKEFRGVEVSNPLNGTLELPRSPINEDDVDPANPVQLPVALYRFLIQNYLISIAGTVLTDDARALRQFNLAYQALLARCADSDLGSRDAVNVSSSMTSVLEDAVYGLPEAEQIAFYKDELRRIVPACAALMTAYRRDVTNGADRLIQSELDDAKRCLRESPPDTDEIRSVYSSLVNTPYTMLNVVRRRNPSAKLP